MDNRREFLKKTMLLSGATGLSQMVPASIQKALNIDPVPGSTYLDAEHIVILMQENRSFDHCFGSLQGVRGFNDPRAITLPNGNPVWLQTDKHGDTYAPFRLDIKQSKITWMGSLPHVRSSQVDAYNGGKHDGWLKAKRSGNNSYADMPLTLGHYTREDLPFNYALADAFTICDQNFCSVMSSTTPNRAFFWSGMINDIEDGRPKANIRNPNYTFGAKKWKTFPELLTNNNIKWKFYQNELSAAGGFKEDEGAWLGNFGCNNLEFFEAYNVKFIEKYRQRLQTQVDTLSSEIQSLQNSTLGSEKSGDKTEKAITKKQEVLQAAKDELKAFNEKNFNALSATQKQLHQNAFVVNAADPNYRSIAEIEYDDNGVQRKTTVPAGDILYQFRKDVQEGKLPTVSWLAGPKNFSDHPSAPWYGAWYVSEVIDILTQNPEVWKKTIFILTYDENDGYYDHIPPFSIPDNNKPGTGKCSAGIDTEVEFVRLENELAQGVKQKEAREAPIGLGFRVPMVIASPWSRGGKVCSQVFEHTSTLQFLETFINKKYNKNIHLENISEWRRTISGNLTSVFAPFDPAQDKLPFLQRDAFVETIYNAKFKEIPNGFKKLSAEEIAATTKDRTSNNIVPEQEKGIRKSCALPYELYVHGSLSKDGKTFGMKLQAANKVFGKDALGAPFTVYTPVVYENGTENRNWSFAAKAGDTLEYEWPLASFDANQYNLRVSAPNGYYREFAGDANDPLVEIWLGYELNRITGKPTGNLELTINNKHTSNTYDVVLQDNGYHQKQLKKQAAPGRTQIVLDLQKTYGWHDFTVSVNGFADFAQRFAGRVETGKETFTDPVMGRMV